MSIETAILADNPTLYWPLDDPSGPAAIDASGHGNTGVYGGHFLLRLSGPEPGTFAMLCSDSTATVQTLGGSPVVAKPYSMEVWLACYTSPGGDLAVYNGNSGTCGDGLYLGADSSLFFHASDLRGGVSFGINGSQVFTNTWHQLVLTHSAADVASLYHDGLLDNSSGGHTTNPIGTNKFAGGPSSSAGAVSMAMAHVALFPTLLTPTQVSNHWIAAGVPQPPQGLLNIAPADLTTVSADLSALQALCTQILAAVRKTY